jgi:hypothetical protein
MRNDLRLVRRAVRRHLQVLQCALQGRRVQEGVRGADGGVQGSVHHEIRSLLDERVRQDGGHVRERRISKMERAPLLVQVHRGVHQAVRKLQ